MVRVLWKRPHDWEEAKKRELQQMLTDKLGGRGAGFQPNPTTIPGASGRRRA